MSELFINFINKVNVWKQEIVPDGARSFESGGYFMHSNPKFLNLAIVLPALWAGTLPWGKKTLFCSYYDYFSWNAFFKWVQQIKVVFSINCLFLLKIVSYQNILLIPKTVAMTSPADFSVFCFGEMLSVATVWVVLWSPDRNVVTSLLLGC